MLRYGSFREVIQMNLSSLIKTLFLVFAFGTIVALVPVAAVAQDDKDSPKKVEREDDDDDEDLSVEDKQRVKLSIEEARTIAIGRVNGRVIDEELEKEKGRLQYAFDIRDADGKVWDVEIDAVTGDVLQAEEDDDDDDATSSKARKRSKKRSAEKTAKVVKTNPT